MTCPVCDQPMSELNRDGAPRTTCAGPECTAAWARRHVDPDCLSRRRRDRVQDVADLLAAGESPFQIARRFGIEPASVARTLDRAGRHDLAQPFRPFRRTA